MKINNHELSLVARLELEAHNHKKTVQSASGVTPTTDNAGRLTGKDLQEWLKSRKYYVLYSFDTPIFWSDDFGQYLISGFISQTTQLHVDHIANGAWNED